MNAVLVLIPLALLHIGPLRHTVMSIIVSNQVSSRHVSKVVLSCNQLWRSVSANRRLRFRALLLQTSQASAPISFRRLSWVLRLYGIDARRASCSCVRPDPSGQPSHGSKPHPFASPSSNTRSEVMVLAASDIRSPRPLALVTQRVASNSTVNALDSSFLSNQRIFWEMDPPSFTSPRTILLKVEHVYFSHGRWWWSTKFARAKYVYRRQFFLRRRTFR